MLNYQPYGPDEAGDFSVTYATPGAEHVLTVAGKCRTRAHAELECSRLNEAQVFDRRQWLQDQANCMAGDLSAVKGFN